MRAYSLRGWHRSRVWSSRSSASGINRRTRLLASQGVTGILVIPFTVQHDSESSRSTGPSWKVWACREIQESIKIGRQLQVNALHHAAAISRSTDASTPNPQPGACCGLRHVNKKRRLEYGIPRQMEDVRKVSCLSKSSCGSSCWAIRSRRCWMTCLTGARVLRAPAGKTPFQAAMQSNKVRRLPRWKAAFLSDESISLGEGQTQSHGHVWACMSASP